MICVRANRTRKTPEKILSAAADQNGSQVKITKIQSVFPLLSYEQKRKHRLSMEQLFGKFMFSFLSIQQEWKHALNYRNLELKSEKCIMNILGIWKLCLKIYNFYFLGQFLLWCSSTLCREHCPITSFYLCSLLRWWRRWLGNAKLL